MLSLKREEHFCISESRYIFFASLVDPDLYTDDMTYTQRMLVKRRHDCCMWIDSIDLKVEKWKKSTYAYQEE